MMNILILEDNLEQAKLLEQIVKQTYNEVTIYIASNISDAEELTAQYTFDLFILDIILNPSEAHDNNGIDFASYIRKEEHYSHFLSGTYAVSN